MKGGENEMQNYQRDQLWLIQALRAEDIRRADDARRFPSRQPSIRRAIGTSIVSAPASILRRRIASARDASPN